MNASVPELTARDFVSPASGPDLLGAYQEYLAITGRGNTAYTQAAKTFFARWPDPRSRAEQSLQARLAINSATRPVIRFLMLHHSLHPGYDYLLEHKFASV